MKHKLIKYIKITIAITLIGALTLPSYAAVNAADGSAFVTKAEFDAALSDFNARLTTFEAGINSKIDSQVSSYLDRNGIWNGKIQQYSGGTSTKTFDIKDTDWGTRTVFSVSSYNVMIVSPWGMNPTTQSSFELANVDWMANGTKHVKLVAKDHFFELLQANKSGLVNINWEVKPKNVIGWYGPGFASWTEGWKVGTQGTTKYLFSNENFTYTTDPTIWVKDSIGVKRTAIRHAGFGIKVDEAIVFRSWLGLYWTGKYGDSPTLDHYDSFAGQFSMDTSPFNFQDYFFVAKGETVGFGFEINTTDCSAFIADSRYVDTGNTPWCKAIFKDCKIY